MEDELEVWVEPFGKKGVFPRAGVDAALLEKRNGSGLSAITL